MSFIRQYLAVKTVGLRKRLKPILVRNGNVSRCYGGNIQRKTVKKTVRKTVRKRVRNQVKMKMLSESYRNSI